MEIVYAVADDHLIGQLDHKGHIWKISAYASEKLSLEIEKIIDLAGSTGKA